MRPVVECVGCRKAGAVLCGHCAGDFPAHYARVLGEYDDCARRYAEYWTECQRCQGSVLNEVLCVNRICPIWYRRTRVKQELKPLEERLAQLQALEW